MKTKRPPDGGANENNGETMNDTKYFDACVESIRALVAFDSSQAAPLPGMPFGKGAADALNAFLDLAQSMGFAVRNYDNYIGEVLFGEGEEFAVLCHLDVVPAGEGWTHAPFGGEIEDGKLYGRGTMDDKGPAVICLYCLKALRDEGFVPRKKIKLIVGCNEESGWQCIEHYRKCAALPRDGFSPDADFPVIYAEKGIVHAKFRFPLPDPPFADLRAGERPNMVCAHAFAAGAAFDAARAARHGVVQEDGGVAAYGVSAHASTPDEGKNALGMLFGYFAEEDERIRRIYDCLFADAHGLRGLRDGTGSLTMSANVASYEDRSLFVTADIRYPATMREEDICARLSAFGEYQLLHCQKPLCGDRDGALVSTLRRVYERETGLCGEPVAIGGGTYARALKNGAGFGPEFPGEPSTIHQKDEYISLENIKKLLRIYRAAIYELTR